MTFNPHNEQERLMMMTACARKSVQMQFSHLPMEFIVTPPHRMFDAYLARHIVIAILNMRFQIPRKRIGLLFGFQKKVVARACLGVKRRRDVPVFDAVYVALADRAARFFEQELGSVIDDTQFHEERA
ncbi:hypothetical protein [Roseibium sediminis]|uniref:hypothetical protein n=1 Tax=Roseibium sediminis TaxID=1775174 RepID=UPI00123D2E96|nr:hypothetical protein [Roseibium sediminis]